MIDLSLLPTTPTEIILEAIKKTLDDFDWAAFGLADLKIRHARNRYSNPEEFPCLTIRWLSDEPRQSEQDNSYAISGEMLVDMMIKFEVETELAPADDEDAITADPTGLAVQSGINALANRALRAPDGDLLRLWADGVSDRGRASDDDNTSDEGRFEQTNIVLYRVMAEDPSILLAVGMNA